MIILIIIIINLKIKILANLINIKEEPEMNPNLIEIIHVDVESLI